MYAFGLGDNKVDILNLNSEEIQETFSLNYASEQLSVSANCETMVVTHTNHLSVMRAFAGSRNVTEYSVTLDYGEKGLGDVVIGPANMAVFFSTGTRYIHVRCLELIDGNITRCTDCGYDWHGSPHATLHPGHTWIIANSNGLHKLEFTKDCVSQLSQQEDVSSSYDIFLSVSGSRVFDTYGRIFNIDLNEGGTNDFKDYGTFGSMPPGEFDTFVSFAQSTVYPYDVYAMKSDEKNLIVYR